MSSAHPLHAEWDAYVAAVRAEAARREVESFRAIAGSSWKAIGRGKWMMLSPIRHEKTPSFCVFDGGRGWHDYGTKESGDWIGFVRRRDGSTFREAVDTIATSFGLETWDQRKRGRGLPTADPDTLLAQWNAESEARRVFEALTALVHLCHDALPTRVRRYLNTHYAYTDDFLDLEKVGWMPNGLWELAHAIGLPFTDAELLGTGCFHPRDPLSAEEAASRWIDPARGPNASLAQRIVFPYWKHGVARYLIGREHFAGAAKEDVTPPAYDRGKYKKLPTWDKTLRSYVSPFIENAILWNEDCLAFIKPTDWLWITEGITDAGVLAMLGLFVLSPVTTSFRAQDAERIVALLRVHGVRNVVLCNDNDVSVDPRTGRSRRPGLEGAKRMVGPLHAAGFGVRIATLPRPEGVSKIDVNEFVRAALRAGEDEAAA